MTDVFFELSGCSSSFLFLFEVWFRMEGGRMKVKVCIRIARCMSIKLTSESSTLQRRSLDMQSINQQFTLLSMATRIFGIKL